MTYHNYKGTKTFKGDAIRSRSLIYFGYLAPDLVKDPFSYSRFPGGTGSGSQARRTIIRDK